MEFCVISIRSVLNTRLDGKNSW